MLPRVKRPRPTPEAVKAGFRLPSFARLRLERFPRGIDKVHIDVTLGPALDKVASALVHALVQDSVQHLWRQKPPPISEGLVHGFEKVLQEHHRAVVKEARGAKQIERVQLFQLSVLKQLLDRIDTEISSLRLQLEDARSLPARQLSGQALQLHDKAVQLGRHAGHLRYGVARHVVQALMRVENGGMKGLRKAALDVAWPVPEVILDNPILQLDGVGGLRDFSREYPALLLDSDMMHRVNACVLETFAAWLPEGLGDSTGPRLRERTFAAPRQDLGSARGFLETDRRARRLFTEQELRGPDSHWLDVPDNATALLGGDDPEWPKRGTWYHPGIALLQRALNRQFGARLQREGLLQLVLASYELPTIYHALGINDAEAVVFDFLSGVVGRRETVRRLAGVEGISEPAAVMRRIIELRKSHQRSPSLARHRVLARFAGDCLRFRRDLKFAWRAFVAMDAIRLISDQREAEISQANNCLQLFCREAALDDRGEVIGHVVIKVDVRGVNELAAQLGRREISAAAHFSRYFYDPVTRLAERFGAQKVVVEGDSITLSILEYGADTIERMAVARACCLAVAILEQMQRMNAKGAEDGLPRIELGLGIAYADAAPVYLYDHVRKVTVSPAIGRARVLASCHALLRESCTIAGGRGLCVASPVHGDQDADTPNDSLVRYNVNGIELDAAAYAQLHVEIILRRVTMREKRRQRQVVLHAGQCTDGNGDAHWLIVREQTVKLWMGRQLLETPGEQRRFYEVVSDARLIARVRERLVGNGNVGLETPSPARP